MNCFYKNNQQSDGLTGKCRDCMMIIRKAWDHAYNLTEKAKVVAARYYYSEKGQTTKKIYRKAYKPTPKQRERYRIAGKRHEKEERYKARRKRYDRSAKGRATKAALNKRYARTDKGRFSKRKTDIKRKHRIGATDCTLTRDQWLEIKERFDNMCAYCGKTSGRLEMDHVIPLSKGGAHTATNIIPSCRTCNARKGSRLLLKDESARLVAKENVIK